LTKEIIIQSEPEKQDRNQISVKNFHNLSDFEITFSKASVFETKLSQRVTFRSEKKTTR